MKSVGIFFACYSHLKFSLFMKNLNKKKPTGIQVFSHAVFGLLRTITTDDQKTMFNLVDVCRALEIKNASDAKRRLSKRGVVTTDTPTKNQHGTVVIQQMTYIDEANLYRCIFQSRKAEAEKFQDWVFEEVLPQIRMTGGYIPTHDAEGRRLTDEEIVERAYEIVGRTLRLTNAQNEDCLTATQVAALWGMDVTSFNNLLRGMGIQHREHGRWQLSEELRDKGLTEVRHFFCFSLKGKPRTVRYQVWTPEGVDFLNTMVRKMPREITANVQLNFNF